MTKQLEAYQNNSVTTATGPKLTLMLYNGCIKFIHQAVKAMDEKDFENKNMYIQKAQAIIQELMLTLDRENELSDQFLPLYEFIHYQLQQGNIKNDSEHLKEALTYVTEFRDTWREIMLQQGSSYVQGEQV